MRNNFALGSGDFLERNFQARAYAVNLLKSEADAPTTIIERPNGNISLLLYLLNRYVTLIVLFLRLSCCNCNTPPM